MTPDYWQKAIEYLSDRDPVLEKIISEYEGEEISLRPNAFYTLARAIVGQQISVKAADSIWKRYEALSGADPHKTLELEDEAIRACGFSGRKVEYIKNIAEFAISHDGVWHEDDEELIKELCKIKGVGRWTAEMFMIFHLGRADIFPIADLGVVRAIEKHYDVPREGMIEFARKWQPYRTVAIWYLWRSLDPILVEY
jgi:DNA-3-methyladenine glycosylase II